MMIVMLSKGNFSILDFFIVENVLTDKSKKSYDGCQKIIKKKR